MVTYTVCGIYVQDVYRTVCMHIGRNSMVPFEPMPYDRSGIQSVLTELLYKRNGDGSSLSLTRRPCADAFHDTSMRRLATTLTGVIQLSKS